MSEDQIEVEFGDPKNVLSEGRTEGVIKEIEKYEHNEYGDSVAVVITIGERNDGGDIDVRSFYNLPDEPIHTGHHLGATLERFGANVQQGNSGVLEEYLGAGRDVEFVLEEQDDEEGFNVDPESLAPLGEGTAEEENGEVEDFEMSVELQGALDGVDYPESDTNIIGQLAQEDPELASEFKDAQEAGVIEVDDNGMVTGV